jgi:hypothetical protein
MVGVILNCQNVVQALSTVKFHKNNLIVLTQGVLIVSLFLFVQKGRIPEATNSNETDAFSEDFGCKLKSPG